MSQGWDLQRPALPSPRTCPGACGGCGEEKDVVGASRAWGWAAAGGPEVARLRVGSVQRGLSTQLKGLPNSGEEGGQLQETRMAV